MDLINAGKTLALGLLLLLALGGILVGLPAIIIIFLALMVAILIVFSNTSSGSPNISTILLLLFAILFGVVMFSSFHPPAPSTNPQPQNDVSNTELSSQNVDSAVGVGSEAQAKCVESLGYILESDGFYHNHNTSISTHQKLADCFKQ